MDMTSPELAAIVGAAMILHQGETERGRGMLLQLWAELGTAGTPLQRCALGHILADTEAEAAAELEWDLRALEAATGAREAAEPVGAPLVPESWLPSLHLSVANGYRKLGDRERARRHLQAAANHIGALSADAYGDTVRGGLRRLQAALG